VTRLGLQEVRAVDRDGLWKAYTEWPETIRRALALPLELPQGRNSDSVLLAGMGGSGSACDMLADWLRPRSRVPVTVIKDFDLPAFAGRNTLAILVSLGGETRETRSLLRKSVERGCLVVAVSSGGSIEMLSRELKVPFNRVERLLVPRASVPSMTVVGARILAGLGLVEDAMGLKGAAEEVEKALNQASASVPLDRNISKKMALQFQGRSVVVYSPALSASVAVHFKNSMNENAKLPVQVEMYPELFHNEIETWVAGRNRAVVMLRVSESEKNTLREVERLKQLVRKLNVPLTEMRADRCSLGTILSWSLVLDLASVYLAVLEGRAPAPTPILSTMKKD
jgi:glucose/mannose-6-phosphate isomerase